MTEKEFRKLVSEQEVARSKKEHLLEILENIKSIINSYNIHFEIVDMYRSGALAKGTLLNSQNDINFVVVVKPKINKIFNLTNKVIINEIQSSLIINMNNIIKASDLVFDEQRNILTFMVEDYEINLAVYYNNMIDELPVEYLNENELKRNQFVELANRDYSYFRNTVQILKYYRDEQKLQYMSGYLLEILLYYSLKEYCFDLRYEDYLNAFLKGLDDFIGGKKIEVHSKMYNELDVTPVNEAKKGFTVIDVATGKINLANDINEIKIGEYRKLKKAISKLVDTKAGKDFGTGVVKLNVTPIKNEDGSYSWSYKIEDTNLYGNGGNYSDSNEDTYTAIYKALLKGLKSVIDNNLNRKQVEITCPKANALTSDEGLSNENKARRKNVLAFIENNQIKIIK